MFDLHNIGYANLVFAVSQDNTFRIMNVDTLYFPDAPPTVETRHLRLLYGDECS